MQVFSLSWRLLSVVLLTDGYIGNENEVLAEVQRQLKPGNRLYSFGVGSSPNRFLLNRIAEIGRGTSQIVRHDEPTEEVAEKFFRQINNPVLTNIQISWEGTGVSPVIYPSTPPDLFAEQPLVLFGRKQDRTSGNLRITGTTAGGKRYEKTFNLIFEDTGNPAIAQLWGRTRIKDLMNQMFGYETKAGVDAVTDTALTYQLLSQYTAFVAVSEEVRVDPEGNRVSMQVPVAMPEGVSYEGIFGNAAVGRVPNNQLSAAPPAPGAMPPPTALYSLAPSAMSPQASSAPKARHRAAKASEPIQQSRRQIINTELGVTVETAEKEADVARKVEESEPAPTPAPLHPHLQIVSVTGLDQAGIASVTQHLQQLNLPSGFSGEIVFEFTIGNDRVRRILLDDRASMLKEAALIDLIKRSLATWRVPQSATGTVSITLSIQS